MSTTEVTVRVATGDHIFSNQEHEYDNIVDAEAIKASVMKYDNSENTLSPTGEAVNHSNASIVYEGISIPSKPPVELAWDFQRSQAAQVLIYEGLELALDNILIADSRGHRQKYREVHKTTAIMEPPVDSDGEYKPNSVESRAVISAPLSGLPIANKGHVTSSSIPVGWQAVRLVAREDPIPAVLQGVNGNTVPLRYGHMAERETVAVYLNEHPAAKSIITTLTDSAGNLVAEILRNSVGLFVYIGVSDPQYYSLVSDLSTLNQRHRLETTEWPLIQLTPTNVFENRVITATGFATGRALNRTGS